MQQTKIYWDRDNFVQVEKIFRKSVEFCNDQDVWKLNVAHVLFMQETKYKEAAGFYEPIVKKHYENVSMSCTLRYTISSALPGKTGNTRKSPFYVDALFCFAKRHIKTYCCSMKLSRFLLACQHPRAEPH